MSTARLNNIKPVYDKENEKGNKFVLLAEDDYRFLRELAERVQALEHEKEHLTLVIEQREEEYKKVKEQNDHLRESIVEAMDLGLYGDSDTGVMTMYDILNEGLGKAK